MSHSSSRSPIHGDAHRALQAMLERAKDGTPLGVKPAAPKTKNESKTVTLSNDTGAKAMAKALAEAKPYLDLFCKRLPHLSKDPDFRAFIDRLAPAIAVAKAIEG